MGDATYQLVQDLFQSMLPLAVGRNFDSLYQLLGFSCASTLIVNWSNCAVKVRSTGADDVPDVSFQALAASTLRTAVDPPASAPLADVEPQPDSIGR